MPSRGTTTQISCAVTRPHSCQADLREPGEDENDLAWSRRLGAASFAVLRVLATISGFSGLRRKIRACFCIAGRMLDVA